MVVHGEGVSAALSDEDVSVAHFEETVTLAGKVWKLPAETTTENLHLIEGKIGVPAPERRANR